MDSKKPNGRRQLTPEQQADAARLKAAYLERRVVEPQLTQERLATDVGFETQGAISQYFTGRIPINLPALLKICQRLDADPAEISPRLWAEYYGGGQAADALLCREAPPAAQPNARPSSLQAVGAGPRHQASRDFVSLPVLTIELAASDGASIEYESAVYELPFSRHTLSKLGVPASAARVVRVYGSSMKPYLNDGDVVGVNTADTAPIRDGKTYALRDLEMLRVKILIPHPGGGLTLRSVNAAEYPDETLPREKVAERIQIIGRVFWRSGIDY